MKKWYQRFFVFLLTAQFMDWVSVFVIVCAVFTALYILGMALGFRGRWVSAAEKNGLIHG